MTASASNILLAGSRIESKMFAADIEDNAPWQMCLPSAVAASIQQSNIANGFRVSDESLMNGYKAYMGKRIGFDVMRTNNVPHAYVLTYTNNPSDGETFVISISDRSLLR